MLASPRPRPGTRGVSFVQPLLRLPAFTPPSRRSRRAVQTARNTSKVYFSFEASKKPGDPPVPAGRREVSAVGF